MEYEVISSNDLKPGQKFAPFLLKDSAEEAATNLTCRDRLPKDYVWWETGKDLLEKHQWCVVQTS